MTMTRYYRVSQCLMAFKLSFAPEPYNGFNSVHDRLLEWSTNHYRSGMSTLPAHTSSGVGRVFIIWSVAFILPCPWSHLCVYIHIFMCVFGNKNHQIKREGAYVDRWHLTQVPLVAEDKRYEHNACIGWKPEIKSWVAITYTLEHPRYRPGQPIIISTTTTQRK